ncbi:ketoacyl-ACP synthase III family protein [Streptomyces sp. NBC_01477]|uniref:ketoacyl-ACP synthase III family protein n=1 Tax=Streptomyces sp. NBC_01477 TaxID=2976015 RepID=UPI002E3114FF|nr:ketoacyl-ACP synthase III family protein [Streptomyces sp. NBC_01477]
MTSPAPATPPYPALTPSALDFTSGPALHLASAAAEIPPALPLADAVRDGLISEEDAKLTGMSAVSVAAESSTLLDLASAAAVKAAARAAVPADDIGTVLFVNVFPFSRPPLHNLATALAESVRSPCAFAAEISGGCVAGLNALTLAAQRLLLTGDRAALVVAGDLWRQPHVDRFNCEPGYIFADGAAAVVLSRDAGYARLLSAATLTDPTLSGLHAEVPSTRTPVDLTARARAFLQTRMGTEEVLGRLRAGLSSTIDAALSLAQVSLADVAHVLVPAIGEPFLYRNYLDPLNVPVSRTTWDHTAVTGHTGAADQFSALAHLVDQDRCASGDVIVLIAEGLGFQWSVVVLEVQ